MPPGVGRCPHPPPGALTALSQPAVTWVLVSFPTSLGALGRVLLCPGPRSSPNQTQCLAQSRCSVNTVG